MSTHASDYVCLGDRDSVHYLVSVDRRDDDGAFVLLERKCGEHVMFEDYYGPAYAESLAFTLLEAAMSAGAANQ
jgi:hypothetical protein